MTVSGATIHIRAGPPHPCHLRAFEVRWSSLPTVDAATVDLADPWLLSLAHRGIVGCHRVQGEDGRDTSIAWARRKIGRAEPTITTEDPWQGG